MILYSIPFFGYPIAQKSSFIIAFGQVLFASLNRRRSHRRIALQVGDANDFFTIVDVVWSLLYTQDASLFVAFASVHTCGTTFLPFSRPPTFSIKNILLRFSHILNR